MQMTTTVPSSSASIVDMIASLRATRTLAEEYCAIVLERFGSSSPQAQSLRTRYEYVQLAQQAFRNALTNPQAGQSLDAARTQLEKETTAFFAEANATLKQPAGRGVLELSFLLISFLAQIKDRMKGKGTVATTLLDQETMWRKWDELTRSNR